MALLAGCTTAFQRADGTYDVPRNVEVRSPFGTNAGFVKLEHCLTAKKNQFGFTEYVNCHPQEKWHLTQSQGAGGTIASGALIGAGIGAGAAFSGGAATAAASSTSSAITTTVTKGHGHH